MILLCTTLSDLPAEPQSLNRHPRMFLSPTGPPPRPPPPAPHMTRIRCGGATDDERDTGDDSKVDGGTDGRTGQFARFLRTFQTVGRQGDIGPSLSSYHKGCNRYKKIGLPNQIPNQNGVVC